MKTGINKKYSNNHKITKIMALIIKEDKTTIIILTEIKTEYQIIIAIGKVKDMADKWINNLKNKLKETNLKDTVIN